MANGVRSAAAREAEQDGGEDEFQYRRQRHIGEASNILRTMSAPY
ncbi:hypothetical protein [Paenibacillus profundus]|nr:hypothetical protein [Paenibacillus profundus]